MPSPLMTMLGMLPARRCLSDGCPHCGGHNLIEKSADESFLARLGCLDCDEWLEPVKLKSTRARVWTKTI